jgi:hypothetical protein
MVGISTIVYLHGYTDAGQSTQIIHVAPDIASPCGARPVESRITLNLNTHQISCVRVA